MADLAGGDVRAGLPSFRRGERIETSCRGSSRLRPACLPSFRRGERIETIRGCFRMRPKHWSPLVSEEAVYETKPK